MGFFTKPYVPLRKALVNNGPVVVFPFQDSTYVKSTLVHFLSASHTEEEMVELEGVPYNYLEKMFPNVEKWGHNGERIQEIFDEFVAAENLDSESFAKALHTQIQKVNTTGNPDKAVARATDSLKEYTNLTFIRTTERDRNGNKLIDAGGRHDRIKSILSHGLNNQISSSNLYDVPAATLILKLIITALTCEDRVGMPGSWFRRKDYDYLMQFYTGTKTQFEALSKKSWPSAKALVTS